MTDTTVLTEGGQDNTGSEDQVTDNQVEENSSAEEVEGDQSTPSDSEESSSNSEDKDSDTDESKEEGAPDKYEDFTLPEGFEVNEDAMTEFKDIAKEYNLPQDAAQKLVDLQTKTITDMSTKIQEDWDKTQKEWVDAAKNDKEYGGKSFEENIGLAHKALKQYGSEDLSKAIELTGMGNHPEFIRMMVKIGKDISEDTVSSSGTGNEQQPRDPARNIYKTMQE